MTGVGCRVPARQRHSGLSAAIASATIATLPSLTPLLAPGTRHPTPDICAGGAV